MMEDMAGDLKEMKDGEKQRLAEFNPQNRTDSWQVSYHGFHDKLTNSQKWMFQSFFLVSSKVFTFSGFGTEFWLDTFGHPRPFWCCRHVSLMEAKQKQQQVAMKAMEEKRGPQCTHHCCCCCWKNICPEDATFERAQS